MIDTSKKRLLTVPETGELESIPFTACAIRQHIYNEHKNGLSNSGAIIRVGRKVLIDPEKYLEWIYAQGNAGIAPRKKPLELRLDNTTIDYLQKAAEVEGLPVNKLAARLIMAGLKEVV